MAMRNFGSPHVISLDLIDLVFSFLSVVLGALIGALKYVGTSGTESISCEDRNRRVPHSNNNDVPLVVGMGNSSFVE